VPPVRRGRAPRGAVPRGGPLLGLRRAGRRVGDCPPPPQPRRGGRRRRRRAPARLRAPDGHDDGARGHCGPRLVAPPPLGRGARETASGASAAARAGAGASTPRRSRPLWRRCGTARGCPRRRVRALGRWGARVTVTTSLPSLPRRQGRAPRLLCALSAAAGTARGAAPPPPAPGTLRRVHCLLCGRLGHAYCDANARFLASLGGACGGRLPHTLPCRVQRRQGTGVGGGAAPPPPQLVGSSGQGHSTCTSDRGAPSPPPAAAAGSSGRCRRAAQRPRRGAAPGAGRVRPVRRGAETVALHPELAQVRRWTMGGGEGGRPELAHGAPVR